MSQYHLDFSRAYPALPATADFKRHPEDFCVTEDLGFEPSGTGEHLFLFIRKQNMTTEALVDDIARVFGVKGRDIGFCGLKDKQGITEQWLSVPLPIKQPIPVISGERWQVLRTARHDRKLKRGVHQGNHFVIRLRDVCGNTAEIEERLRLIGAHGFPNYFGEQRFGREGANVSKAEKLFAGELRCKPFQRSMYFSAARSYLFNAYLSLRVSQGNWASAVEGDCFNLEGSNALFGPEPLSEDIARRLEIQDIHAVGVLVGEGDFRLQGQALSSLLAIVDAYPSLYQGLLNAGLKTAWRPLRAKAKYLNWKFSEGICEISFFLSTGSYATALIHELVTLNEAVW